MPEREERFQSAGEEEEQRTKRRKRKISVKEERKTDEEGSAMLESSIEGLRDAAGVGLGLIGENNVEKKGKKKKKSSDVGANKGSEGAAEGEAEERVEVAVADDENEEKMIKKKRRGRKDEANTGNGEEERRTDEGKLGVQPRKSEEAVKERVELWVHRERKRKDKSAGLDKSLESFEAGVFENVSGDEEGRLGRKMEVRLEEHCTQYGEGKSMKKTKAEWRKRDRNMEDTDSFSEQHTTLEQKPITEDERIADEFSHGSHDDDKMSKKNLEEESGLRSGEISKRKKTKDKLTEHGEPILKNMSDNEEMMMMNKKKRRKVEANTGNREEWRTHEGKNRVEMGKSEEVVKERVELQETRERKGKGKNAKVGKNLEPFEVGALKNVSRDEEGRLERKMEVRLEEHCIQHGDGKSLNETKTRRRKRDRSREDTESFSEQYATKEPKPVAKDERIVDEGTSHGSHDDDKRRKKNLEEENSPGSGETRKREKAKDKIVGHGEPILENMPDRGLGTGNKLTMTADEAMMDDNRKMRSSMTREEKKTREKKKKKSKGGTAEDMDASREGISNKEIAGENNRRMDVGKTSKISADEGTSDTRNVDDTNASTTADKKKKVKKVNFSGHVEVFPSANDAKSSDQSNENGLVQGKRFSQEEDEMIRQAVFDYIEENQLGEDGLNMVLHCKSHPQVRNCWKEIGAALPWRPRQSVYWRAHTLFQRSESRKWEPEELDLVQRYYKEHGPKWKELAELLGKHRIHVKDAWRRIKLTNANKGHWSQEEYQALFDLVNVDLQLRAFEEKKTKHGMLRENISWGAISKKLSTRHDAACCIKWYGQLTSPMVTQGLWADTDDYCLIDELLKLDASCIEEVEWDSLLENRSGDLCLKRWKQMTRYIGGYRENSFMEQVELLATRYCPNMLQYRTGNLKKCKENVDESESSPV